MQLKALIIPADSNEPVEVKEYEVGQTASYLNMLRLSEGDSIDFVSLGDSKHQLVIDDIGLMKAGPVTNIRACHLICLTRGVPLSMMLSPVVGNVAVVGYGFIGEETDVSEEIINTVNEIEKELKS